MNNEKNQYQKLYVNVIKLQPTKLLQGLSGDAEVREYRRSVWDEDE